MKKLFLSLLLCLCCVLCACGDAGSISPDHDNAQGVHSNDTQSDETGEDSPHSSTSSEGSADGDASGTFVPSENAVKALDMKTAESFFGSKAMQNLFVAGYEADIVSRSITDENNVLYSVEFTNRESGEKYLVENMTAQLEYDEGSLDASLNNIFIYGAVAAVCGDEIIIGENGCLHFYDLATFEDKGEDIHIDLPHKAPVIIHNVTEYGGLYYASYTAGVTSADMHNDYNAYYTADRGFLRFDKDGKFSDHPLNLAYDEYASPENFELEIRGNYPQHLLAGFYIYDFEADALFTAQQFARAENEGGTFILEKWDSLSPTADDCWRVTNIVDGNVKEIDTFHLDVGYIFGINQQTNSFENDLIVQFAHENRDMIVTCPHTETTLVLDRGSDTGQVVYNPTAKQIDPDREKIYSRDERYTIYSGASTGGGDAGASQKILHDSQTGEYKYIGTVSIYDEIGFFSNNDIWVLEDDDFIIYEKGMPTQQPKFVLSDNFTLGRNINDDGVWGRFVFAVRRDPEKQDYVVMYGEFPDEDSYRDFINYVPDCWRPTYKMAVLDPDGTMVKTIDTGVQVSMRLYDFADVDMYLESENLMHFEVYYKGKISEATVNIATGEVNVIYDLQAQQG